MKWFVLTVMLVSLFLSSQLWAGGSNLFGTSKSKHHSSDHGTGMLYMPQNFAPTIRGRQFNNGRYIRNPNTTQFQHRGEITKTIVGSTVRSTDHP